MDIPILIEPKTDKGFRAIGLTPLGLSAEGTTREEALQNLRTQLQNRLQNGAEIVSLRITGQTESNPWIEFAGMFKDDPYFDEWQDAIAENRRKIDADPQIP